MRRRLYLLNALLCLTACALSSLGSAPCEAATIAAVDNKYCHMVLDGEIVEGDFEKFKVAIGQTAAKLAGRSALLAAVESGKLKSALPAPQGTMAADLNRRLSAEPIVVKETPFESFRKSEFELGDHLEVLTLVHICLNSGGGSYDEAYKIIKYMTAGPGVATVIRAEDRCFSACALIFLFGNFRTYGENRFIDRRMDVRGKLGFHAPYVEADNLVSQKVASLAYSAGVKAVANLLELDKKGFLNRALVVDFLRTGPDEVLNLDTVGKAGEWAIELMGYVIPGDLTEDMLSQACKNDIDWTARRRTASSTGNLLTRFETAKRWLQGDTSANFPMKLDFKIGTTKRVFTRPTTDEENAETDSVCCVIRLERYPQRGNAQAMKIDHETRIGEDSVCRPNTKTQNFSVPFRRPSVGSGGFSETTPIWFIYPPSTKLSEIASR